MSGHERLEAMANSLGSPDFYTFSVTDLESDWANFAAMYELDTTLTAEEQFNLWDTNGDGKVNVKGEMCIAIYNDKVICETGSAYGGDGSENQNGTSGEDYNWEVEEQKRTMWAAWYRMDLD